MSVSAKITAIAPIPKPAQGAVADSGTLKKNRNRNSEACINGQ
jgi:hypothetical protein